MLMSKQDVQHRRAIQQTLDYQAEQITRDAIALTEAVQALLEGRDNDTCSKLLLISFNLGRRKEMVDRMLSEVRSTQPTRHLTTAPPTKRF